MSPEQAKVHLVPHIAYKAQPLLRNSDGQLASEPASPEMRILAFVLAVSRINAIPYPLSPLQSYFSLFAVQLCMISAEQSAAGGMVSNPILSFQLALTDGVST
jgi:hypothetical protein